MPSGERLQLDLRRGFPAVRPNRQKRRNGNSQGQGATCKGRRDLDIWRSNYENGPREALKDRVALDGHLHIYSIANFRVPIRGGNSHVQPRPIVFFAVSEAMSVTTPITTS